MSFTFLCKMCPMKFTNEADLQIHGEVHTESRHAASEPLFGEFLSAFFPDLNGSYTPARGEFSRPDAVEEDPSSSEDDVTYTTLTTMKVPCNASEKATGSEFPSSVPLQKSAQKHTAQSSKNQVAPSVFLKKLPSAVRLVNTSAVEAFQAGSHQFNKNVLKPVYIARRPPSFSMIQHHYGDDGIQRYPYQYRTGLLQPAILTKCVPTITNVSIRNPKAGGVPATGREAIVVGERPGVSATDPDQPVKVSKRGRRNTLGEKPYACEVCDKRFAFIKNSIAHKRIHIVGKLFSCYLCHKRFGYSYKLNQHMRLHTGEGTAEECSSCKKIYKNVAHLRRHRCRGVNKLRPYACTVCKRTFGRINYLNLHKRCHVDKQDPRKQIQESVQPEEFLQDPLE